MLSLGILRKSKGSYCREPNGVLLIFLTCHSYLLFVGAGRYGNTKYTAPASASLLKLYCS